jgi:hypothetical protein
MDSCAISVVIPVFNRQELGDRAVLSACSQAVEGMEVVVVDDGSQPPFQLPEIAGQIAVRLIRLPVNQGASTARNVGIKAARGEWIALLDSDDYWLPLTLEPRFAEAKRHGDSPHGPLIAHAAGFVVKRQANDLSDARIPREAETPDEFACGCWFAPGSTILFRKDLFERAGPWDAKLARLEDYDWFLRFALAGGRLKVWNSVAAITEVEGKPPPAVLEAAAHRLLAKYTKPDGAKALSGRMARRMRAYLDVERASMRWHCGQHVTALLYLARSFLRVPRLTIHLRPFWAAAPAPVEAAAQTAGPDNWLRYAQALNQGHCAAIGETLEIKTDARSGGYSALLPLPSPQHPDRPICFSCRFEVVEGSIGICAATADCTILAERIAHTIGRYDVDIVVPFARDAAGILVRNYAMTGRPSLVRIVSIRAEPCPAGALPHIPSPRPSRVLRIPLRSYGDRESAHEVGDSIITQVDLDTGATAVVIIDAWDTLGNRITTNIVDKLAPTLAALRANGIPIMHVAHDKAVHPLARPLDGEIVVPGEFMDVDFIADMLRHAGVTHLLYLGYYSNQCVLRRSLGMLEMHKRGFQTILVRDASAARENSESLGGEWFHRAAVHFIETNLGPTVTAADIQAAMAEMAVDE